MNNNFEISLCFITPEKLKSESFFKFINLSNSRKKRKKKGEKNLDSVKKSINFDKYSDSYLKKKIILKDFQKEDKIFKKRKSSYVVNLR